MKIVMTHTHRLGQERNIQDEDDENAFKEKHRTRPPHAIDHHLCNIFSSLSLCLSRALFKIIMFAGNESDCFAHIYNSYLNSERKVSIRNYFSFPASFPSSSSSIFFIKDENNANDRITKRNIIVIGNRQPDERNGSNERCWPRELSLLA